MKTTTSPSKPSYLQRPHPQLSSHQGLGLQHGVGDGGTQHSICSASGAFKTGSGTPVATDSWRMCEAAGFRRNMDDLQLGRFELKSWIYSELLCNMWQVFSPLCFLVGLRVKQQMGSVSPRSLQPSACNSMIFGLLQVLPDAYGPSGCGGRQAGLTNQPLITFPFFFFLPAFPVLFVVPWSMARAQLENTG